MKKLFIVSLLSFIGVAASAPTFSYAVKAEDEVPVTNLELAHSNEGFYILVGQEVELEQSGFTFMPATATDKTVKYHLAPDSFEGDLPPAMFSKDSTFEHIIIKGLMVGSFKVYFDAVGGSNVSVVTTFHVISMLEPGAQYEGITEVRSPEENGVEPGTESLYKKEDVIEPEKQTPLYINGSFNFKAVPTFLSQVITVDVYVIVGIVLIGLLFLYILFYSLKKALWKRRR